MQKEVLKTRATMEHNRLHKDKAVQTCMEKELLSVFRLHLSL